MFAKLLRNISAAAGLATVIASCASGDPTSERVEDLEEAQRGILCCNRLCEDRGPCVETTCGGSLLCCQYKAAKDGTDCVTPENERGACVQGTCCACAYLDPKTQLPVCANCDDRNPCTYNDCGKNGCANTPVPDGESCGGGNGVCIAGRCCTGCVDKEGECRVSGSGDPEFCGTGGGSCDICEDDGNPCTDDVCTGGKCAHPPKADGISCESDNDVCNGKSTCQGGQCRPGTPLNCLDNNPCTDEYCDPISGCTYPFNTGPCSDMDPCTVNDRCDGTRGECIGGAQATCNDNNPCTEDGCSRQQGGCVNRPVAPNTECDDRNECTSGTACDTQGRCVANGIVPCEDDNPCTIDGCNPGSQACDFSRLEEPGTACTPPDNRCILNAACSEDGSCTGGFEKDCDDDNPCTQDSCDPETGGCVNEALDSGECSDNSACTIDDRCEDGECVGDAIECTALDDCHRPGECDPTTGLCDDPRMPAGTKCESETGTCNARGVCDPDPVITDGGAPGEAGAPGQGGGGGTTPTEGGAPGEAGTASTDAGRGATGGGGAGAAPSGQAGEAPSEGGGTEGRGAPFEREPGGCACSTAGTSGTRGASIAVLAGALALGLTRRRRRG